MASTLLFCGSLALGEASCHVRTLEQTQREIHVARPPDNIQHKLLSHPGIKPRLNLAFR